MRTGADGVFLEALQTEAELRAAPAAQAVDAVLRTLHRDGTTAAVRDRLMPFEAHFALMGPRPQPRRW